MQIKRVDDINFQIVRCKKNHSNSVDTAIKGAQKNLNFQIIEEDKDDDSVMTGNVEDKKSIISRCVINLLRKIE